MSNKEIKLSVPDIPMLLGEKNLEQWKSILRRTLKVHRLCQYIDTVIPEPQGEDQQLQWESDRATINLIMAASLTHSTTHQTLINNGWNPEEEDPKVTYETILRAIPKVSEDAIGALMTEFGRIQRDQFDSFEAFVTRIQYLRRRLKELDCEVGDKPALWIAIGAIKDSYKEHYMFFVRDMSNKVMTWEKLMTEYSAIAAKERMEFGMASVRITTNSKPEGNLKSDNKTNNKFASGDKKWCGKCQREVSVKAMHCKECDKCHGGQVCWKMHPELAPNIWKNNQRNTPKDSEKTTPRSTTAAAGQNSGLGTPSTTTSGGVSGLLWSANFAAINPDFLSSPRN